MIELGKNDIPKLLERLQEDKRNLFFINDLELYKLGKEIHIYKVDKAYALNWLDSSILLFAPDGYDKSTMLEFLKKQKFSGLNGAREYLEPIEKELENEFSIQYRDLLMVDRASFKKAPKRDTRLRELFAPEDYELLFDLYTQIPSFTTTFASEDREEWAWKKAELEYPATGVGLYIGNKIVSGAYLSAATRKSAMVVSVATAPEYENNGYATSVISELVDIGLNENNIGYLCLWYSDDKARHVYEKVGFKSIGRYAYFSRKEK